MFAKILLFLHRLLLVSTLQEGPTSIGLPIFFLHTTQQKGTFPSFSFANINNSTDMLERIEKALFGPLWRSEDMKYVRITMQRDVAHEFVAKVGETGLIEFVDVCKKTLL